MISCSVAVRFNRLPAAASALRSGLPGVVTQIASDGAGLARGYAPVDTGDLVGSIGSRGMGRASAEFFAGTDHGMHQEFGTRYQAGTPFMRPAAEALPPKAEAAVRALQGRLA